jgi:hypothetical protein
VTPARAFARAVGAQVIHCTARANLAGIAQHGLLSPHDLALLGGHDPQGIGLRQDRGQLDLGEGLCATLNHQRPILEGLGAANTVVDGHDAASWAAQLDRRIFLWPGRRGRDFANSIARDIDVAVLWLDSMALYQALGGDIWLSPINSGNFRQGGARARRGDWLYVRASDGMDTFRTNRQRRGLVKSTDQVRELSLTQGLPPQVLRRMLCRMTTGDRTPLTLPQTA